jgi:uncharacterized protein (TIGR02266 family)
MSDEDHRRSPRVLLHRRVWCEGQDVTLYVRALNASAEGMFIRTPKPLEAGGSVRISFDTEAGHVVADARVVWSRPAANGTQPGMGVEIVRFEQGADAYRALLDGSAGEGERSGSFLRRGESE